MKLGAAATFDALARAAAAATAPVVYEIFPLGSAWPWPRGAHLAAAPRGCRWPEVNPELDYPDYIEEAPRRLRDFFVCPFPYAPAT